MHREWQRYLILVPGNQKTTLICVLMNSSSRIFLANTLSCTCERMKRRRFVERLANGFAMRMNGKAPAQEHYEPRMTNTNGDIHETRSRRITITYGISFGVTEPKKISMLVASKAFVRRNVQAADDIAQRQVVLAARLNDQ